VFGSFEWAMRSDLVRAPAGTKERVANFAHFPILTFQVCQKCFNVNVAEMEAIGPSLFVVSGSDLGVTGRVAMLGDMAA
jgi:cytochrome c2